MSSNVQQQLANMVAFIEKEAQEKASEIEVKTEEEFTIEKARLVQTHKQKIAQDFARKEQQVLVDKKIAHSHEITRSRLAILKAREEGVNKVLEKATHELQQLSKRSDYEKLLVSLILQALAKLVDEPEVSVQCRDEDRDVAARAVEKVKDHLHHEHKKVQLSLDLKNPLPPSRERAGPKALHTCSGGVILSTKHGRILCDNTLDVRLRYAYEKLVPLVRHRLFEEGK
eukprot:TRINITY_DN7994_c0_g1_i9.p1 TRINITY_DN7994_c0_g1~~TRINITY_DN7994_c0_g1_i9.p1  ORF type:complete len:262 (-),score=55.94 TRINITY_DN7994_c0_g1_i9:43-726(-)